MLSIHSKKWMWIALVSMSFFARGGSAEETGPHGGVVMSNSGQQVEVSIDSNKKRVHVYVLKRTKDFPGAIGISLKDSFGRNTNLELKTSNPKNDPIQYSTPISGGSQSYVGFELKIPFQREKPLIFTSPDQDSSKK